MMKKITLKTALLTIVVTVLFVAFISNLRLLGHIGINTETTFIKMFIGTTVFHFLLASWLLKKHAASPWLFLLCIAPDLVIDAFCDPGLMPLRAPFATIFPILGTGLGFILKKARGLWFSISAATVVAFLLLSWKVLIPKISYAMVKRDIPKTAGILNGQKFKTLDEKLVSIEDTAKAKVKLIEWYFVGCGPCEEKYTVLKQLADTFKNDDLNIVMVCCGLATKEYDKFVNHATANSHKGITFLYDADSINMRFCKGGISRFPTEFLAQGQNPPQPSLLGFDKDVSNLYLTDEIKKIRKLLHE